ncbi:haloacid dehalogenase [Haloferula helveola]|uniref:Haloacid dehalogenase n=1 Tax=Haloferula helveola TaxID=490095 RepID=A0ABM7RNC3_9BACT|nr:haloacid dehalogenase [Haloferula helveola]
MTEENREKFQRGLALFDFDGTLIPWDTQVIFANCVLKREPLRRSYLALFALFAPLYKILGDEGLKRVFLSYLWRVERPQLEEWVRGWVAEWVPDRCYAAVVEKLEAHKAAGHLTVLASASPEFYVREVGRVLGFDLALGTVVEQDGPMRLFPDLTNHKGEQKVRRLSEIIGTPGMRGWAGSHGYTDSTADLPMMLACQQGTVVNPSERLTAIAEDRGWEILRPEVPWKGKVDKIRQILRFAAGI